ncbi:hypothetical protein LWI28_008636 [Acer negundo]|uniref:Uncharacterized protein n=1 Tax=Acer negundo TaxID=4023 RepID=A0AAD5IUN4_ACENE|nr:hypothetical protein LWI28_008636 [Acer negundo]
MSKKSIVFGICMLLACMLFVKEADAEYIGYGGISRNRNPGCGPKHPELCIEGPPANQYDRGCEKLMPNISTMEVFHVIEIQDVAQNIRSYASKDHLLIITTEDARSRIVAARDRAKDEMFSQPPIRWHGWESMKKMNENNEYRF